MQTTNAITVSTERIITTKSLVMGSTYVHLAASTDTGRVRSNNQDHCAIDQLSEKGVLAVVADGMGGYQAGEVASQMAVDAVMRTLKQRSKKQDFNPAGALVSAVITANREILECSQDSTNHHGMGTTLTTICLDYDLGFIGHIGDSRAYLLRQNTLRQITRDHSWVADRVRQGILTEEEAEQHQWRNVITNALGTGEEFSLDISHLYLHSGDRFLICSDGISNLFSEQELQKHLSQDTPEQIAATLMDRADERGSPDNITVVVMHVKHVEAASKPYNVSTEDNDPQELEMLEPRLALKYAEQLYPTKYQSKLKHQPWYPFRFWLLGCLGLLIIFLLLSF